MYALDVCSIIFLHLQCLQKQFGREGWEVEINEPKEEKQGG